MNTMFYLVGQRAECHPFNPIIDDAATDLAEQAAADYWKRTGIANSSRPLKITLLDERGQHYGTQQQTAHHDQLPSESSLAWMNSRTWASGADLASAAL